MKRQISATFAKKTYVHRYTNDKKYCNVRDHYHFIGKNRGAPHCISIEIHVDFHNVSNYVHHFIIKKTNKTVWKRN